MKKFFHEFKEFAMRGNVLDMAIGVVIGAAFGKITLKKKDEEPAPEEPAGPTTEELLAEIRDLLKEQK